MHTSHTLSGLKIHTKDKNDAALTLLLQRQAEKVHFDTIIFFFDCACSALCETGEKEGKKKTGISVSRHKYPQYTKSQKHSVQIRLGLKVQGAKKTVVEEERQAEN